MANGKLWNKSVIYNEGAGFCIFLCSRLILYVDEFPYAEFIDNGYFNWFRLQTLFRANLVQKLKTV